MRPNSDAIDPQQASAAAPVADNAPVVLLVDDAPDTLGLLCDALDAAGYTVLVARDGAIALARLELVVPDAIVLDAVMPGLSGFETCRRIKDNPALSHIPVIFMTGLSETPHIVQAFDSGGVDYVVKPVRVEEVLARLATHMRNAHAARLARAAVDIGGMGVLMIDAQRRIAWRSPQAAQWLRAFFPQNEGALPPEVIDRCIGSDGSIAVASGGGNELCVRNLGRAGLGETMLLLQVRAPAHGGDNPRLNTAALTPRETEVLSWLAKGKTNRDIADILGMSPRTVNKHLEHIFEKLGVETRAAAAAIATRALGA